MDTKFLKLFSKNKAKDKISFLLEKQNRVVKLSKKEIKKYKQTLNIKKEAHICNAPFTSLYFGINGEVGVCACNKTYIIGNIQHNTLKEIWQGDKIQKLREIIRSNSLPIDCYICKHYIKHKAYSNTNSISFINYDLLCEYPQEITFETSYLCNLDCIMCYNNYAVNDLSREQKSDYIYNKYFIEQLLEFIPHLKIAKFLGGEPFLIPLYYKIWDLIKTHNPKCSIHITTNGTIFNNAVNNVLANNLKIIFSLDTISKTLYSKIRKGGNFEYMMDNLDYFSNKLQHSQNLQITTCFMQQNWHEIPDIIKFSNKHNSYIYLNVVLYPSLASIWQCDTSYLKQIKKEYQKVKLSKNNIIETHNYNKFNELKKLINTYIKKNHKLNRIINNTSSLSIAELIDLISNKIKVGCEYFSIDKEIETNLIQSFNAFIDKQKNNRDKIQVLNIFTIADFDLIYVLLQLNS